MDYGHSLKNKKLPKTPIAPLHIDLICSDALGEFMVNNVTYLNVINITRKMML